ncbi:type II toxin-antitoxin system VapC family toxin [Parvularcula sp. IMCC14364]|uniref:type II toxin-antitoxin system VapC family toxin n=1 Tax=Parvularcula sp. IMCC14364 TaxID=3067902 RepID=UPI002741E227|nr:type II toxin-antitoxin system VapC family toxin [Parvularcula sp. IMCC14364]
MSGVLLDTCALIWLANKEAVEIKALDVIAEAWEAKLPVCVSPISAWEIGMLHSKGKLPSTLEPKEWLRQFIAQAKFSWVEMSWELLVTSSSLPGNINGDPADRIIAATARQNGYMLITRDRNLLNYAKQGYLLATKC